MNRRNGRQDAIREIVRNQAIRTQQDLVAKLQERGFDCTQATISRDITDMGLRKLPEGIYVLAEDLHLQRMVSEFVLTATSANNLVVIKTLPGTAPGVAAAVDAANLREAMGSVAGNDTALVVTANEFDATALVEHIQKLGKPRGRRSSVIN